jgi:hypothetical protein
MLGRKKKTPRESLICVVQLKRPALCGLLGKMVEARQLYLLLASV